MVVRHRLDALATRDVGIDGAALDRAGPDQRDLDHQVFDRIDLQPQDRLELRATLDLDDAQDVAAPDHLVDLWVVERDADRVDAAAVPLFDQAERVIEMPQAGVAQEVHLDEARVRHRVLVPLADVASLHRCGLHGYLFDDRCAGDDHAARVLAEVAWLAAQLLHQPCKRSPDRRVHPPPELRQRSHLLVQRASEAASHALRQLVDVGLRQPERFADVADRHRVAILDHVRDERRVLRAVRLEDVLEHALARLAGEVEVDIGHVFLLARFVEEAPDEEVVLDRIDAGEPQQIAHQRPDGRAATARRQVVVVGVAHQLPVAEEETRLARRFDQAQLVLDALFDLRRRPAVQLASAGHADLF